MRFSGMSPDGLLPEMIEYEDHPWFIGVQFHPELKSRPFEPHPLFASFVERRGGAEPAGVAGARRPAWPGCVGTGSTACMIVEPRQRRIATCTPREDTHGADSPSRSTARRGRSRSTIPTCRCSTRCATSSASTIRASAAGSASAAPARCMSTAARCAPASRRSSAVARPARSPRSPGLGTPEKPHPVQTAWIEEQVNQCGYCINGWIMTAAELLDRNPHPTEAADQGRARRPDLPLRHPCRRATRRQARRPAGVRRGHERAHEHMT